VRIAALILLGFLSFTTHAVVVSGLHDVRVVVTDQSAANRRAGIEQAYQQVLVKVSGHAATLQNPLLQKEQSNAESMVSQIRYVRGEQSQLFLQVSFSASQIQALLKRAGEPVWGSSRPLTLVWLAQETDGQQRMVTQEDLIVRSAIQNAMEERGIPVLFPSNDLDDELTLPVERLWGLFSQDIALASERYPVDGYLAGRIIPSASSWYFAGQFSYGADTTQFSVQAPSPDVLALQVADKLADTLASRYAVTENAEQSSDGYVIRVNHVANFSDYQRLLNYLDAHIAISNTRVLSVNQDEVTLSLTLATSWPQTWDVLALDKRLKETDQPNTLQWQP
jgi:hypothetical protein